MSYRSPDGNEYLGARTVLWMLLNESRREQTVDWSGVINKHDKVLQHCLHMVPEGAEAWSVMADNQVGAAISMADAGEAMVDLLQSDHGKACYHRTSVAAANVMEQVVLHRDQKTGKTTGEYTRVSKNSSEKNLFTCYGLHYWLYRKYLLRCSGPWHPDLLRKLQDDCIAMIGVSHHKSLRLLDLQLGPIWRHLQHCNRAVVMVAKERWLIPYNLFPVRASSYYIEHKDGTVLEYRLTAGDKEKLSYRYHCDSDLQHAQRLRRKKERGSRKVVFMEEDVLRLHGVKCDYSRISHRNGDARDNRFENLKYQ